MKKQTLKVTGMSCAHCENKVKTALENIGVKAKATAKKNMVEVSFAENLSLEQVKQAITELGYTVE